MPQCQLDAAATAGAQPAPHLFRHGGHGHGQPGRWGSGWRRGGGGSRGGGGRRRASWGGPGRRRGRRRRRGWGRWWRRGGGGRWQLLGEVEGEHGWLAVQGHLATQHPVGQRLAVDGCVDPAAGRGRRAWPPAIEPPTLERAAAPGRVPHHSDVASSVGPADACGVQRGAAWLVPAPSPGWLTCCSVPGP